MSLAQHNLRGLQVISVTGRAAAFKDIHSKHSWSHTAGSIFFFSTAQGEILLVSRRFQQIETHTDTAHTHTAVHSDRSHKVSYGETRMSGVTRELKKIKERETKNP